MVRFNPGKRHKLFTKKRKELWHNLFINQSTILSMLNLPLLANKTVGIFAGISATISPLH